jgi:hypothetical protein
MEHQLTVISMWIRAFPESISHRDHWDRTPYDWALAQHADPAILYLLDPLQNHRHHDHRPPPPTREYTVCNQQCLPRPTSVGTVTTATNSTDPENETTNFIQRMITPPSTSTSVRRTDSSQTNPVPVEQVQIFQPHFIEDEEDVSTVGSGGISSFPSHRSRMMADQKTAPTRKNPIPRQMVEI